MPRTKKTKATKSQAVEKKPKATKKPKALELPTLLHEETGYEIHLVERDDAKTLTEFHNSGKVISEAVYDDGTPSIDADRVVVLVRK